MYCNQCGKQLADNAKFCSGCGTRVNAQPAAPVYAAPAAPQPRVPGTNYYPQYPGVPQEEMIDLSNMQDMDKPQEKKHKGTVWCAVLLILAWVAFTFLFGLFLDSTGVDMDDDMLEVLFPAAFVCIPVSLVGLLVVGLKQKAAGPMRKIQKNYALVFHMMSILISTLAVANGLSQIAGGASALAQIVTGFLLFPMLIGYFVLINISANENGKEGTYAVLKAFFFSFIPAIILGYLLMKLFLAMILVIGIGMVALFSFFGNGGYIIYRRDN